MERWRDGEVERWRDGERKIGGSMIRAAVRFCPTCPALLSGVVRFKVR
jgi:hypothetical protein